MGKSDLLKGAVVSFNGCSSCTTVDMEIVDGYVKGFNLTPDAKVDQKKWLLEFKLYLEAIETYEIRDTIYVKQYFYPSFTDN